MCTMNSLSEMLFFTLVARWGRQREFIFINARAKEMPHFPFIVIYVPTASAANNSLFFRGPV